jgi:hypothetical protein
MFSTRALQPPILDEPRHQVRHAGSIDPGYLYEGRLRSSVRLLDAVKDRELTARQRGFANRMRK